MIFDNVVLQVTDEAHISQVAELLAEQARLSSEAPGCERFEVYQSQNAPESFFLIEQWASQQDLDQHRQALAFQELYIPKVLPLVTRQAHACSKIWPG